MIREIHLNDKKIEENELKEILAGIDTGQHGPCSCDNCGTRRENDTMHANNDPI